MRRILFCILIICVPHSALAHKALICAGTVDDHQCFATSNYASQDEASRDAFKACYRYFGEVASKDCATKEYDGDDLCHAVADYKGHAYIQIGTTPQEAERDALKDCNKNLTGPCKLILTVCDGTADPHPEPKLVTSIKETPPKEPAPTGPPPLRKADPMKISNLFDLGAVGTGLSYGLGIILALLIYAKRAVIANFIIHGNLPYEASSYADDVQVLFRRTQRVNWYGRVVFGIVGRLGMTKEQLLLVRRYWLGRVIAFDSLRRQRQNTLARMHLQLAATVKSESKEKTAFRQFLAALRTIFFFLFYLFRALFSFLFGFFFIRVTIAKLARGKLVESTDLVLILQAKEAIEQSAKYLKEYLVTAETFNEGEELFEPERPVDTVLAPLHRRGQT